MTTMQKKAKYSIVTKLFLPLISDTWSVWDKIIKDTYLGDHYSNNSRPFCVYVLTYDNMHPTTISKQAHVRSISTYIEEYVLMEGLRVFVMKTPDIYKKDYSILKKGLYSKISEETKRRILHFFGNIAEKFKPPVEVEMDKKKGVPLVSQILYPYPSDIYKYIELEFDVRDIPLDAEIYTTIDENNFITDKQIDIW